MHYPVAEICKVLVAAVLDKSIPKFWHISMHRTLARPQTTQKTATARCRRRGLGQQERLEQQQPRLELKIPFAKFGLNGRNSLDKGSTSSRVAAGTGTVYGKNILIACIATRAKSCVFFLRICQHNLQVWVTKVVLTVTSKTTATNARAKICRKDS